MFQPTKSSIMIVNDALTKAGLEAKFDYRMKDLLIMIVESMLRKGYNSGIDEAITAIGSAYPELVEELKKMKLEEVSGYGSRD